MIRKATTIKQKQRKDNKTKSKCGGEHPHKTQERGVREEWTIILFYTVKFTVCICKFPFL